ncbi:MAG: hypothetical protein IPL40_03145 [Proteobacteria bacterium]|nr:hypothetical protein [Pseudomonadota bacterium]
MARQADATLPPETPVAARPRWLGPALGLGAVTLGLALAWRAALYALQLGGIALLIWGSYALWLGVGARVAEADLARCRGARCRGRLAAALPWLALIGVAAALLWPCLIGRMPLSADHPVHLTRAWHFVTRMLARGRLSGWSDLWFAGWPAGEDYPPLGDYLIGATYLGSVGLLGWEGAYALAFLIMFAGSACAIYAFGRMHFGRLAGFVAALCFLLDRGAYREGGWSYTVWWGVWPQVLSTAFTFAALAALDPVLRRGRPRDFVLAAFCTALALLAHPAAVICFGLGVPVYLLVRSLDAELRPGAVLTRALAALGLGAALAAYWLLPFMTKGAWMARYGETWKSLPVMAQDLWRGTLFTNGTPIVVWLGVLGGLVALRRRQLAGVFLLVWVAVLLFLASSTAFERLDLLALSPAFGQVQFQRLSIPAKLCVFLLAGYAVATLFARVGRAPLPVRQQVVGQGALWRRWALGAVAALAAAPFIMPLAQAWRSAHGADLGHLRTRASIPEWADYQRFLAYSRELARKERGFFRIAYVADYNDHFFSAAPLSNGLPALKLGFTPCTNFIHKPDQADPELYRALSVKYVVTRGAAPGPRTRLLERFGPIAVYTFEDYSARRWTLQGPGVVRELAFEPERGGVRLQVSGAGPSSRLILHFSNYANWRARLVGGRALPITTAGLAHQPIFVGLPAPNGTIAVDYAWPLVNGLGSLLSWGAVALLLVLGLRPLRRRVAARWGGPLARAGAALEARGVVLVLGALALALVGLGARAALSGRGAPPMLREQLALARVELRPRDGASAEACGKTRVDRFQCSRGSWNYVGPTAERVGGELRRCIWAHPIDGAGLRIVFPGVRLGRAVVGHHGLSDEAVASFPTGAAVRLGLWVDGEAVATRERSNAVGWEAWRVDTSRWAGRRAELAFEVSAAASGGRHYCFAAQLEP